MTEEELAKLEEVLDTLGPTLDLRQSATTGVARMLLAALREAREVAAELDAYLRESSNGCLFCMEILTHAPDCRLAKVLGR